MDPDPQHFRNKMWIIGLLLINVDLKYQIITGILQCGVAGLRSRYGKNDPDPIRAKIRNTAMQRKKPAKRWGGEGGELDCEKIGAAQC